MPKIKNWSKEEDEEEVVEHGKTSNKVERYKKGGW